MSGGASTTTPLWQVQLAGGGSGAFSFRILSVAKEALEEHPNDNIRSLRDLEGVLRIRLVAGAPAQAGPSDPDGLGIVDWQLVIYATAIKDVLEFIQFVLDYKVQKGYISGVPELIAQISHMGPGTFSAPWKPLLDENIKLPKPFSVLPPKGRRHIVVQLEKQAEIDGDGAADLATQGGEVAVPFGPTDSYVLTFYGGIYHFKDRFEERGVPGALLAMRTDQDQKEYVRYLEIKMDEVGMRQVRMVLEEVLKYIPLYFINLAGASDSLAIWLQKQSSIVQAEESAALNA